MGNCVCACVENTTSGTHYSTTFCVVCIVRMKFAHMTAYKCEDGVEVFRCVNGQFIWWFCVPCRRNSSRISDNNETLFVLLIVSTFMSASAFGSDLHTWCPIPTYKPWPFSMACDCAVILLDTIDALPSAVVNDKGYWKLLHYIASVNVSGIRQRRRRKGVIYIVHECTVCGLVSSSGAVSSLRLHTHNISYNI